MQKKYFEFNSSHPGKKNGSVKKVSRHPSRNEIQRKPVRVQQNNMYIVSITQWPNILRRLMQYTRR